MAGLNKKRKFYIFTGTGVNGKSLISNYACTLGEYYYKSMSPNYYYYIRPIKQSNHTQRQLCHPKTDSRPNNIAEPEQYCRAFFLD